MEKTPKKILKEYGLADNMTLEDNQKYIRENGTDDYIAVDGVLFTMEEYDMSGNQVSYFNKRNQILLINLIFYVDGNYLRFILDFISGIINQ